ncbi:hypothetical protein CYY_009018, partial [Polysphondylium violaceum]
MNIICNDIDISYSFKSTILVNVDITQDVIKISNGKYSFQIKDSKGELSNTIVVYGIDYPTFIQSNFVIFIISKGFDAIDTSKIIVGADLESFVPITYINDTTSSFILPFTIAKTYTTNLYDSQSSPPTNVMSFFTFFSPTIDSFYFKNMNMYIHGHYYSTSSRIKLNSVQCDSIEAKGKGGAICRFEPYLFLTKTVDMVVGVFSISEPSFNRSIENEIKFQRTVLLQILSSPTSSRIDVSVLGPLYRAPHIFGHTLEPYPVLSYNASIVSFIPPTGAYCDYLYLGFTDTQGDRISNSLYLCPTPVIHSISPRPDSLLGGVVTVTGSFFNTTVGYLSKPSTTLNYIFKNGSLLDCPQSTDYDPISFIYTFKCYFPPGSGGFSFIAKNSIGHYAQIDYSYTLSITLLTSNIKYGTAGKITIHGEGFSNPNVFVGGSECLDVLVENGGRLLTCLFKADVLPTNNEKTLELVLKNDGAFAYQVFSYICPTICSSHGVCNIESIQCFCENGWSGYDCSTCNPSISMITSTKYGAPGTVTIVGNDFVNLNLVVTIGGSFCGKIVVSQDLTTITCLFQSDVSVPNDNTLLEVSVTIDHKFTTSKQL